jgi:hypothetical protein
MAAEADRAAGAPGRIRGEDAGETILRRLRGQPPKPFRFSDRGDVAVIGRLSGVTNIGWLGPFGRQSGFIAWALWLGIHIVYLIGFANRIVVSTRWAFSFLTKGRSTRLITGCRCPRSRSPSHRQRRGRAGPLAGHAQGVAAPPPRRPAPRPRAGHGAGYRRVMFGARAACGWIPGMQYQRSCMTRSRPRTHPATGGHL